MFNDLWILIFAILLGLGLVLGEQVLTSVGSLALLATGVAWLWNRVAGQDIDYERLVSQSKAFVGETIELEVSVSNRKPIPLSRITISDNFPTTFKIDGTDIKTTSKSGAFSLIHSTSLSWYERVRWNYKLKCLARGIYKLGPAVVRTGDGFGFFHTSVQIPTVHRILVYPRIIPLENVPIPALKPLGEIRGTLRIFEDVTRPNGIRNYLITDPMNRVDWKATAKTQSIKVRTFEPTISPNVMIMLNVDTREKQWEGYTPLYLERAITVTASVAYQVFHNHHSVGLFTNGTSVMAKRPMHILPSRSPNQLTNILEALTVIGPVTSSSMDLAITREKRQFNTGTTIVLVTAILPQPLRDTLGALIARGCTLYIISVGTNELEPLSSVPIHSLATYLSRIEEQDELLAG